MELQTTIVSGSTVTVRYGAHEEQHAFPTAEEAAGRAAIVEEALSWTGTPFVNCGDIKGPNGAVDCAMLLVRSYVDTGRLAPFDPRPYSPSWNLHRTEQKFLNWIETRLGAHEVDDLRLGDVIVWQFGRCFSHGGIAINSRQVVHAYYVAGIVLVSDLHEPTLESVTLAGKDYPRPRKYYDVWGRK